MSFLKKRIGDVEGGFGESLRELRELRGYSLEELGRLSGIHPLIVFALEEERIEDLSDPAYAERHVQALADALQSRSGYLLEKYRQVLETRHVQRSHALFPAPKVRRADLFVRSRAVAFAGFLLLVGCIGAYVLWQVSIISSVPSLIVFTPTEGAMLTEPRAHVTGMTDVGSFVDVNGIGAVVDAKGQFAVTVDLPRGVSLLRVEARRRHGTSAVIERHVSYSTETPAN